MYAHEVHREHHFQGCRRVPITRAPHYRHNGIEFRQSIVTCAIIPLMNVCVSAPLMYRVPIVVVGYHKQRYNISYGCNMANE